MRGVFKPLNSDYYYIDYRLPNGKRIRETTGFTDKKLAEDALCKVRTLIREGKYFDQIKTKRVPISELVELHLNTYSKQKKSYKSDLSISKTVKAYFGNTLIGEISPLIIEKFKQHRLQTVTPASVNRDLAFLKTMFNKAVDWGYIHTNPMKKVKLLKEQNHRLRYLEKEEYEKLLSFCNDNLKKIVIIAVHTGLRKGELLNLKWKDCDFKNRIISIYESKSGNKRHIPMNDLVYETLISVKKKDSPVIFGYNPRKAFEAACDKAGIKDFRFHDLRHTFASWLVMLTGDLNTVRELLGHANIQMTLKYAHLSPNHKKHAIDLLGNHLRPNLRSEFGLTSAKNYYRTLEGKTEVIDTEADKIHAPLAQSGRATDS